MPYTQENSLIAIDTPLGKDVLLLVAFRGQEGLSRLFNFELDLVSENHRVSFEDIIGKSVTISVVLANKEKRYFNGIIARFSQGRGGGEAGGDPRFSHYRATMVPWTWLLTMTSNSRIFQKLSIPDIVEKIFRERGFADFEIKLGGAYKKREYCVQYRETDFNFVSRLLEEEGIWYFFKHEDGKHTIVLADVPNRHTPCPMQEIAKCQISAGAAKLEEDVITELEKSQEIRPGKYSLSDYNFEMPSTGLEVNVPAKQKLGPGEREIYDYPGDYSKKAEGERLARIRMEEEEAQIVRITGSSYCRAFTSGYRFTLSDFYRDDMNNKDYVLTSITHEASQHWGSEAVLSYKNYFTCIPFDVPYRPKRVTPRPVVEGSQTAIVVGPSGSTNHIDEAPYGMIKVQFHWDREGMRDENSTCWIRVAYPYGGEEHGVQFTPLVGDEVLVDFLEGNPDRPVILGSLFKGQDKALVPPQKMIENQILTPYGHRLTMSDKAASIALVTGGGETVRMSDAKEDSAFGNSVRLFTKDGHTIELAQGAELKGIALFTGTKEIRVDLDAETGQVRVNNTAAGGGWILLECPNGKISLKANEIEITGTAFTDIKGGVVNING